MMKTGTPKSNGHQLPLYAPLTAVVMMNPHPMESRPHISAPFAILADMIASALSVTVPPDTTDATIMHPMKLKKSTVRSCGCPLLHTLWAIPVKSQNPCDTTASRPKANSTAPKMPPPTFKLTYPAIPIDIPASTALKISLSFITSILKFQN